MVLFQAGADAADAALLELRSANAWLAPATRQPDCPPRLALAPCTRALQGVCLMVSKVAALRGRTPEDDALSVVYGTMSMSNIPPPSPSPPPPSPSPPPPVLSPPPAREPIGTWSPWFGAKKGPALYGGICPCGTFVKASAGAGGLRWQSPPPALQQSALWARPRPCPAPAPPPPNPPTPTHTHTHTHLLLQLWNIWTDQAFTNGTEQTPINGISGQCSDNSSLPVGSPCMVGSP